MTNWLLFIGGGLRERKTPNYQKFWSPAPLVLSEEATFIDPEVQEVHSSESEAFVIAYVLDPAKYEYLRSELLQRHDQKTHFAWLTVCLPMPEWWKRFDTFFLLS